jgi:hypothetical protein
MTHWHAWHILLELWQAAIDWIRRRFDPHA